MARDRAATEPGRVDHHHRPQPGHRPTPAGVGPGRPPGRSGAGAGPGRTAGGGAGARRPTPADLHLLPPGAGPQRPGGADAAAHRRAADARDRPVLPRVGVDDGPASGAGQEQDPGRGHPLPGATRRRAARPPPSGAGRDLPRVQRGLRGDHRRRSGPGRPVPGGDPPGPAAGRAHARRARGPRPAGPAAPHRVPAPGPVRRRRRARTAGRPGPVALGPRPHRRGPHPGAGLPAAGPARAVPGAGRHQRRPLRCRQRRRHRLVTDRAALRPAARHQPDPRGRPQPGHRGGRDGRARPGPGHRRRAGWRPRRLSPLPRHPSRPPPTTRSPRRGPRRVRRGHGGHVQPRRAAAARGTAGGAGPQLVP